MPIEGDLDGEEEEGKKEKERRGKFFLFLILAPVFSLRYR